MKSTVEDDKIMAKIPDNELKTILEKCNKTITWLDHNQTAEVDEFKDKQKETENVCNPIIT